MQYEIDAGGNTPYPTIGQALEAARKADDSAPVLTIRAGAYREKLEIDLPNLTLRGEGADHTRIVFGDSAHLLDAQGKKLGTFRTATLRVLADDVTLHSLTVENDAGPGERVEQAIALYLAGDRCAVYDCALLGHQDTLFIGPDREPIGEALPCGRRAYLDRCLIQGNVDFIFGSYAAWFEGCTLRCVSRHDPINAMIAAPNTPDGQPYGLVFHRCTVDGDCGADTVYLGRPWRPFGRAAFLHCVFPASVAPAGWLDWASPFRPVWPGLCETADTHTPARHPGCGVVAEDDEARYTPEAVLSGEDGWNPAQHN